MKNITKNKIVLVTLCFLLGFSMINFTIYQGNLQANRQPNLKTPNSSADIYTLSDISDHLWSPDGTKVAYIKSPSGEQWNCELWVADKNPSDAELINHVLIFSGAEYNGLEDWQGDWILFRIRFEEGNPSSYYGRNELWKIRADGTGMTQVTFSHFNGIRTSSATWPNRGTVVWGRFIPGTNLVYFRAHNGNGWYRTYVCNDDGTDAWYDISYPDYTWRPALSPTGNKLLWGQQSNFGQPTTHKACNVDGSGTTTIKAFTAVIAVTVLADGNTVIWSENDNVYAIDMDGTNERTVIDDGYINEQWNYDPSDGQGLIMGSDRSDGNMHIYKINVDGTGLEQLTDGPYLDEFPILSLDGQYLSYLRLPYDFDKGSCTQPYPYELVVKRLGSVSQYTNYNMIEDHAYSWIDASGGTELILSDDGYATIALPFSFTFYDLAYSTIYLGANGYLSFTDSTPSDYTNDPIPSGDLDNYYLIAPFWEDLYLPYGGHIYVQSFGNYWVAEWQDIYHINGPLLGSFEVVLYDTGEIIFNYDYLDYTSSGYTCGLNLGVDTGYYNSYVGLDDLTDDFSLKFTYDAYSFFDDFESGLSKWQSITGLWHLTDTGSAWPDPCHSPIHSMWFGSEATGDFDTGSREMGELISNPFSLPMSPEITLEFYHWREGEGGSYDCSSVYISIDGTNWDLIYSNYAFILPWQMESIDITPYGGNPSVQLRFFFDTIDSQFNNYRGWLVDDIMIKYEGQYEHDLNVYLDTPVNPEIGNSYTINATVTNTGTFDETDVDLFLYLDDVIVSSTTISSLPIDASEIISYVWIPPDFGIYNFTAYTPPVTGEILTINNFITEIINIVDSQLFDGMYTNYTFLYMGEVIGSSHFLYSYVSGPIFQGDWWIYLEGSNYNCFYNVNSTTRIMTDVWGNLFFLAGHHDPGWIFTDTNIGDNIPIAILGGEENIFNVTDDLIYDLPGYGPVEVWVLEDLTVPGGIAWYEKSTGILLNGTFINSWGENYYLNFIDTNVNLFDHDLGVTLEIPTIAEIDNPYIINATITNTGTFDETYVDLFLYLDDVIVGSTTISSLPIGASETINYMWTPTEYKTFNFTVYAPPVPYESTTENNIATELISIIETKLFDGLYIKHTFSSMGEIINSNFTYTPYTSSLYHETFGMDFMGTHMSYTWVVDPLTRLMSGGSMFGDGCHTPGWIFTDISLYDTIPIAVDGEGDHDFYVARELVHDLPGFGLIGVWELEDLTQPGGIAWYEKSTGILLNGTFIYAAGAYNYTMDFVDTNAELTIIGLPPGEFTLSSNAGTPDVNGVFDLSWTSADGALTYSVYQYSSFITEINGSLTLLGDGITDLSLALSGYTDGTYYFIVVAHNDYGDTKSNCIQVNVALPPGEFTLSSNAGTPDVNGVFDLSWTSSDGALTYSVYQYSSFITEINGSLTLLGDGITDLSLALSGYTDGTYYFIAVAHNANGDTLSNCIEVIVQLPGIPGYDLYFMFATIGIVSAMIIRKRCKKSTNI